MLIDDASLFGVAERGMWHFSNVGAELPRRLWQQKDAMSILAATSSQAAAAVAAAAIAPATSAGHRPSHGARSLRPPPLRMSPSTSTRYVYGRYRVSVAVDASPSMFALDVHAARLPFHDAADALAALLRGLTQPMRCAAGDPAVWFVPELHVSVLAQTAFEAAPTSAPSAASTEAPVPCALPPPRLLVHGQVVTAGNVEAFIGTLAGGLRAVEREWFAHAQQRATAVQQQQQQQQLQQRQGLEPAVSPSDIGDVSPFAAPPPMPTAATVATAASTPHAATSASSSSSPSLTPLLESAVYVLKLLPPDACPAVVVVTDAVAALPAATDYGSVVMQVSSNGEWRH